MRRLTPLLAVGCILCAAAPAQADDFCVSPADSCTAANTFGTLQPALDAADNRAGDDRVLIGAGTFTAPSSGFAYSGAQPGTVDIRGAGAGATILRPNPSPSGTTLRVEYHGSGRSTVSGLTIGVAGGTFGLFLPGNVDGRDLVVQTQDGQAAASGVALRNTARLIDSRVDVSGTPAVTGGLLPADNTSVLDSKLKAVKGVTIDGGQVTVNRSTVTASDTGLIAQDAKIVADGVVVDMRSAGVGSLAVGGSGFGSHTEVDARHLTVIGNGTGVNGVMAWAVSAPATARVRDSIIRVGGRSLIREAGNNPGDPPATLEAADNDYRPDGGANVDTGNGTFSDLRRRTDDPRFLGDPQVGEFRLRFDSPLIDAGAPGTDGGATDAFGSPRVVDGDGDGGARRDLGAWEYQRDPPVVTAAVDPLTAPIGTPLGWSATASDPEGDPVTVGWSWDDGATASGATASHGFATPGRHTGTATVTDATGRTASATAGADVTAPGPGIGPADTTAPVFSIFRRGLRLSRKRQIAVRVDCAATEPEPCAGNVRLASAGRVGPRRRTLGLGTAAFRVSPGKTGLVRVKVPARAAAVARRLRKVKVRVTAVAADAAGNKRTASRTLTLVIARTRR